MITFESHGVEWELNFYPGSNPHDDPMEISITPMRVVDMDESTELIATLCKMRHNIRVKGSQFEDTNPGSSSSPNGL